MGRAQLAPGARGTESVTALAKDELGRWRKAREDIKPERYKATCRYRDTAGEMHQPSVYGETRGQARSALNRAVADIEAGLAAEAQRASERGAARSLEQAISEWLEECQRRGLAENSLTLYRGVFARHIQGTEYAALPIAEANSVPTMRRFLQGVADRSGAGAAKTARSVISGAIGIAVDDGELDGNAARSIRPVRPLEARAPRHDNRRALTEDERQRVLVAAAVHPRVLATDMLGPIQFMAALGVRISECLAVRWDDVDLDARTVHIRGTKSTAADRVLPLPLWLHDSLSAQAETTARSGYVFTSPGQRDVSRPRDRRNATRVVRELFDSLGLDWARSHTFRRTTATRIVDAGHSVGVAADMLGHASPAMTASVYIGRKSDLSAVAAVL